MRKIFPACCASATAPHRANVTAMATSPTNFRFSIPRQGSGQVLDFGLSEEETNHRIQCLLFMLFSPNPKSAIENPK
jgi:hypothetical protein